MLFQNQNVIKIGDERTFALFAPQHGGRLVTWWVEGQPVIHWPENADWSLPRKIRGGNPLLFPFVARHLVEGQLGWWIDESGSKRAMPVHGFAHSQPFTATLSADGSAISMVLQDNEQTHSYYPYSFHFEALYRLAGNRLEVSLITSNPGDRPLPYYPGHHFYFSLPHALRATSTIDLPDNQRHTFQRDGSISAPEQAQTHYQLNDPQIQDRMHVLRSQQQVCIATPALGRNITIQLQVPGSIPWYAVTTWSETPEDEYYCVEPWVGLPNAIHHQQGLRWLAPGQKESAICHITATFE